MNKPLKGFITYSHEDIEAKDELRKRLALMERQNETIEDYSKAIERKPDEASYYKNRGVAYLNTGKFHRALDDFSKVINLVPDEPLAYYAHGMAYRNLLVFEKAIQDFSTAIRLKLDEAADAYTERGVTYHSKGDVDKAIEDYNAAIALDSGFAKAYTAFPLC